MTQKAFVLGLIEEELELPDFGLWNAEFILVEELAMENTKTMTVQLPEETYQRMKAYLKRHQVKQKDFVTRLVERP